MIPPVSAKMVRCFLASIPGAEKITVRRDRNGIRIDSCELSNEFIAQPDLFWRMAVESVRMRRHQMERRQLERDRGPDDPGYRWGDPDGTAAAFRRFCAGPVPMEDIEAAALHAEFLSKQRTNQ